MAAARQHSAQLKHYVEEMRKNPPLSHDEEQMCLRKYRAGDQAAQDQLIKSNLRFVIKVAREYEKRGVPLDVLINEGALGLHEALKRYDETKGHRFVQYAAWWIRNHMRQVIADQSLSFAIPVKKMDLEHKVREAWQRFEQREGRKPTIFEIADELAIAENELVEVIKIYSNFSIHLTDKESLSGRFQIPIEECEDIRAGDLAIKRLIKIEIDEMLEFLNPKEAEVLGLFFGINQERRFTLEEIGDLMQVSRERIRQIKEAALDNLRESPNYHKLEIFMNWLMESHTFD